MKIKMAEWGEGKIAQIMNKHVSKCKNNKIKFKIKYNEYSISGAI
jgi:hypothetical protein